MSIISPKTELDKSIRLLNSVKIQTRPEEDIRDNKLNLNSIFMNWFSNNNNNLLLTNSSINSPKENSIIVYDWLREHQKIIKVFLQLIEKEEKRKEGKGIPGYWVS